MMEAEKLIKALDSVTWYNGLAEIIVHWKDEDYFERYEDYSLSWKWEVFHSYDQETQNQLQVIWMICVELFGECGTSPRTGWIELKNKEDFYQFIDDITETYQEVYEKNEERHTEENLPDHPEER